MKPEVKVSLTPDELETLQIALRNLMSEFGAPKQALMDKLQAAQAKARRGREHRS